ncbi:MAG: hypothetical protein AABN95_16105 [Acidobacteriota bacterium]
MKIEADVRVVKSSAGTEVFITRNADPYINTVFHLPPDAQVKSGDSIEIVQTPEAKPLSKAEAEKREAELPGKIEPAG